MRYLLTIQNFSRMAHKDRPGFTVREYAVRDINHAWLKMRATTMKRPGFGFPEAVDEVLTFARGILAAEAVPKKVRTTKKTAKRTTPVTRKANQPGKQTK